MAHDALVLRALGDALRRDRGTERDPRRIQKRIDTFLANTKDDNPVLRQLLEDCRAALSYATAPE